MKKIMFLSSVLALTASIACGQADKSKRPSPPAKVTETISSGATITIDYSQPSLKGRSVGKEVAPYGKVWRTGANERTTFETSKDVTVEGKPLKAGKYGVYSIPGESEWIIIFSKNNSGGALDYKEDEDLFRVKVKPAKTTEATEKMTFKIAKSGTVSLLWGNDKVDFKVQ
jgi:hypothetical protein